MELVSTKTEKLSLGAIDIRNSSQIESALLELLWVPDERLKSKIVAEIVKYLKKLDELENLS